MIPIISAHYGFAAAGSPAAFPRSRRIQQIQEPAADVPSPTGFGYGQGLHEKNHVRIEPAGGGADGGALVGRALETLRAGGYLIVDELENSINKQLVFAIMDLFASPVTNPHGATLLFSTHYPELLDHFTRKDSIWFAVRDGKGFALRNLGAYLGRTDLKKSVSFFANRVPGTAPSYAAVRALQDYAERYVHA